MNKVTYNDIERYLKGETSPKETIEILEVMAINPSLQEHLITAQRLDYANEQERDYGCFIPIRSMAADDGKNLCDFQCETYILKKYSISYSEDKLTEEAKGNYWLSSQGTPLYNMGRMLEEHGFIINRCFDANLSTLTVALETHEVIVVVNGDTLTGNEDDNWDSDANPNHAVIVLSVDVKQQIVVLYNPATGNEKDEYPLTKFAEAWRESKNYMVTVKQKQDIHEYNPQPIDISGVELSPELLDLTETIAENAHDVWGAARKKEGYRYGPTRIDQGDDKQHPDMVSYSELPDSEKQYDRDMALHTIKLLKRLGYRLVNVNNLHRCPDCGEPIEMHNLYCSHCGKALSWEDFK